MLSGSVAMSTYILPRATRDFDFVVNLQMKDVDIMATCFKDGFYCNIESMREAVIEKGKFNIIDHASGFKADFVILKNQPYRQTEFSRRIAADFFGLPISIVSAEDLLLSKLIWIQQLQSNIQMEDIRNLSQIDNLDWEYIKHWVNQLQLNIFDLFHQ